MAGAGKIKRLEMEPEEPTPDAASEAAGDDPAGLRAQRSQVPLIFEESIPGRRGVDLPARGFQSRSAVELIGPELCRSNLEGMPEVSEPQALRHFLRLSQLNFGQALQFYPLGSCTMKYNPVLNDECAALPGFARLHPETPPHLAQGALELMADLEAALAEISAMDAISLHPAAGAQGELAGLLIIRAYHQKNEQPRHKVIIPDTAHGTNPASSSLAGFQVVVARSGRRGYLEAAEIKRLMSDDVAALMVTNPSTLGIFEPEIRAIADVLHERGAMLYLDGANFNALLGVAKPGDMGADVVQFNLHKTFSTPHGGGGPGAGPIGVKKPLERFLPVPRIVKGSGGWRLDSECPDSIGKLRSFYGNFGMLVRAYTYILALGGDGLEQVSRRAILGANYIGQRLREHFPRATQEPVMHECVLTHDLEKKGVTTLDIAKRLLDFDIHPPTIYFPLVVHGALMIEPTETETKQTLDEFVDVMNRIYSEAQNDPQSLKDAPRTLALGRVDEALAARHPILRWRKP